MSIRFARGQLLTACDKMSMQIRCCIAEQTVYQFVSVG
jgi:hypothetical protein